MHTLLLLVQFGLACKKPVEPTPVIEAPIAVVEKVKATAALPVQVITLSKKLLLAELFQSIYWDGSPTVHSLKAQPRLHITLGQFHRVVPCL